MTTAFISMWITNTATTAMMTPIMEAVLKQLDRHFEKETPGKKIEENSTDNDGDVVLENPDSSNLETSLLNPTTNKCNNTPNYKTYFINFSRFDCYPFLLITD